MLQAIIRWIDSQKQLSNLLSAISGQLAVNRGFPMIVGTGFVILSLFTTLLVIPFMVLLSDNFDSIMLLLCIPATILHLGIIIAFIGFMMSAPLGKGYKE